MIVRRARPRPTYLAASIALGSLLFAGCGSSDDPPAGATKLSLKLTDAGCDPAQATAPAGPVTFDVTNDGAAGVTELELLDGDSILGERENLSDGLSGELHGDPRCGYLHALLPGRRLSRARHPDRHRTVEGRPERRGRGVRRPIPPLHRGPDGAARGSHRALHAGRPERRCRGGEEPLSRRTAAVREGRAGGRVLRRPRPRDRCQGRKHTSSAVFAIPPGARAGGFVGEGMLQSEPGVQRPPFSSRSFSGVQISSRACACSIGIGFACSAISSRALAHPQVLLEELLAPRLADLPEGILRAPDARGPRGPAGSGAPRARPPR